MDKATRLRWSVLLTALAATVLAIAYPVIEPVAVAAPSRTAIVTTVARQAPMDAVPRVAVLRGTWEPLLSDPFAPRGWNAPQPAPVIPTLIAPEPQMPIVATAPTGPPPLPFQFVGQMNDSTDQVVYLARGEQALLARPGEVLEGTYKVLAITALQIEFEHLPTGHKQALVFPSRNN